MSTPEVENRGSSISYSFEWKSSTKGYFVNIVFYFLSVVTSVVNFLCSIVFFYPKYTWDVDFLVELEYRKIKKHMDKHSKFLKEQADKLKESAHLEIEEIKNSDGDV